MAIDETGLTKGLVRKLNALRKSVGDDLAEEVFARWLEREAASQARSKPCSAPGSLDTSLSHAAGLIEIAACHA